MLAWLRSFEAAARCGSFTRAANELCITQGAVSQQVKQLELALGFPLLLREPNGLALTLEGQKLAPVVELAFGSIRRSLTDLTEPGGTVPITLSCSPSFAIRWLTPRLNRFMLDHPKFDIRLFGEFHRLGRGRMAREGLQAAVRFDADRYTDVVATEFLDEYLLPVASPAFVAVHPGLASPRDLEPGMLLHDARPWDGVTEDEEWRRWLDGADVSLPNLALGKRFNLSQLAIGAALAGEGIAMGRLALVLDDLEAGRLVDLFGIVVPSTATYRFLVPSDSISRVAAIADWLVAEGQSFVARRAGFLSTIRAG